MQIHRQYKIIKYWMKIVMCEKTAYVCYLYMCSLANIDAGHRNNWAVNVRKLLCSSGFGDIWRDQCVFDADGFCNAFKTRLLDVFKQEWSSRRCSSSRASFYHEIVKEHCFHHVIDTITVPGHRSALLRLICSSHRLGVETGRWARPKITRADRKCPVCNKLDDEYHFLLECTSFHEERNKFIKQYYRKRPSMLKCVSLLNSSNKKELRNLAKYVFKCFSVGSP